MKSERSTTNCVMPGNSAPMSLNILAKVGTTSQSMTVTASTAITDQDARIHQRAADFAAGFARLADLLVEFRQHQRHLSGDLTGADDFDPMVLKDVQVVGRGGVQGAARGHAAGDIVQHMPHFEALVLLGADLNRLQQRRARRNQRRKLLKEGHLVVHGDLLVRLARHAGMSDEPVFKSHLD